MRGKDACNQVMRLAGAGLLLAAALTSPLNAQEPELGEPPKSLETDLPFDIEANARAIARAAANADHATLYDVLDERISETGGEIRSWVAAEVIIAARAHEQPPEWIWSTTRSIAAHYRGDAQRALILAQEPLIEREDLSESEGEAPQAPVAPALWLAQLEIWPVAALEPDSLLASRNRGRDRLLALRSAYPLDQRVIVLLAHAALADGDVPEALALFENAETAGVELEEGWRERVSALAGWQPAFDSEQLLSLDLQADGLGQVQIGALGRVEDLESRSVEALDLTSMPELHKLAAVGDEATLGELLPAFANLNEASPRGGALYTPLHLAAELGNLAAIQELAAQGTVLDRPADPLAALQAIGREMGAGIPGATPLQVAVAHGQGGAASLLMQLGAVVNTVDAAGLSPLLTAGARGDHAMVAELLAHGADARFRHDQLGDASDVARFFGQGDLAGTLDAARRTQQLAAAIDGATTLTAGTAAPYSLIAGTVLNVVGSPQGQQMLARGVVTAWNDGSIIFRLGLGGSLLLLGTLFRYGPRLVGRLLLLVVPDVGGGSGSVESPGSKGSGQAHVRASLGNCYRGRLRAPAFGMVDGTDVEVKPDIIKAHGYATRFGLAEGEHIVRGGVKLGLFAVGLLLAVLFWVALMGAGDTSPGWDIAGFIFMLVVVPALAFLSDGLATVLMTEPMTLELHTDEIEQVTSGASAKGWDVVAQLRKLGEGRGELVFSTASAEDANSLASELLSLAHARPLAG